MPAMLKVQSSTIYEIGYDDQARMLFVRFRASGGKGRPMPGALYRYVKVPRMMWTRFQKAPSVGRYLADRIKGRYGYSRWTGHAWRPEAVLKVISAKNRRMRALQILRDKQRSC
jgi:hypothetical protein